MGVAEETMHPALESLGRAAKAWAEAGDARSLSRWLGRELDADGVPIRLEVPWWHRCLEILAAARRKAGAWPEGCDSAVVGLAVAALRFARPDGTPVLQADDGYANGHLPPAWVSADGADWYRGSGIERVLGWWFGLKSRPGRVVPPPLPTWSAADRVLAMLRLDWLPGGDMLAVDHRDPLAACRLELFGQGRSWLGPQWTANLDGPGGPASRPRPSRWFSGGLADLIEWGYRADRMRITRSALVLRARRLALLSVLAERREASWDIEPELRLATPAPVVAAPLPSSRALALAEPGRRGGAQAVPIALPCRPYPTERGSFRAADRALVLRQAPAGRRCWLPLLISWDNERHRRTLDWRVLTVSERSRPVPPDRALAARVSWGRQETYVIYRSLGPPARRAFLGHQTAARFLVAAFDEDGDLEPLLTVE
jgi:hypothetical protein